MTNQYIVFVQQFNNDSSITMVVKEKKGEYYSSKDLQKKIDTKDNELEELKANMREDSLNYLKSQKAHGCQSPVARGYFPNYIYKIKDNYFRKIPA